MPQMTFILVYDSIYIYFGLIRLINLRLDSRWQTGKTQSWIFFFSGHKTGSQPQGTWSGIDSALVTSDTKKSEKKWFHTPLSPVWQPDSSHSELPPSWQGWGCWHLGKVLRSSRQCVKHHARIISIWTWSQFVWLPYTMLKSLTEGFQYRYQYRGRH